MALVYTRTNLKTSINRGIHNKKGLLIDFDDTVNEAVRSVISDVDLRSNRRRADLQPKLFTDVFDYAAPTDLKRYAIIDIPAQVKRAEEFYLVPEEEFDRLKGHRNGMIALDDYNGVRTLRISVSIDDKIKVVSKMDSLTSGGGTWELYGDGTNLTKDSDNFVVDAGSINWDISSAGGTTAGIKNTSLDSFDLDDDYLGGNGSAFIWAYLNSSTDVTNFILHLGSSESAYHAKTITTRHDGTAFANGWNLLRFDLTSLSDTGSPNDNAINYAAIFMTKAVGKVSETDYRFDHLVLRKGEIHRVKYYSKYGWTNSSGTYLENSTDDADLLVADTDEYELFVFKGREIAAREAKEFDEAEIWESKYDKKKEKYIFENPSEVKIMTSSYYEYSDHFYLGDSYGDHHSGDHRHS